MRNKIILGCIACLLGFSFMIPVKATGEREVEPIADAEVNLFNPAQNSGSSDYLHIGDNIFGDQQQTFLKFEIPSISTEIIKVTVKTYWYSFMCETPLSVSACQVSNDWEEYNITWNNKPIFGILLDSLSQLSDGGWFNIDINTSLLEGQTYLSLCIYENTPYKPDGLQGNSRETGYNTPVMIIEFDTTATDIAIVVVIVIVALIGLGILVKYTKSKTEEKQQTVEKWTDTKTKEYINCQHCGSKFELEKIDKYCLTCGKPFLKNREEKIDDISKFCPFCGTKALFNNAVYCESCGKDITK